MISPKTIQTVSGALLAMSVLSLGLLCYHHATVGARHGTAHSRGTVRVAVYNGCGRAGLAGDFARIIRDMGFDVVNGMGGNAASFDFEHSVVVDRKGNPGKARLLAEALGVDRVIEQRAGNEYVLEDVMFIVGRDWDRLRTGGEDVK